MGALNPPNICLKSWWTDHHPPCPSSINLSGDPWPPVTPPFTHIDAHTLFLPHPSTIWIMHHQTVGNELMSQLLRTPGETPVHGDGYTKPSPRSGCTHHQMSRVRGDELWVIPLAPLLQCHHIRRQEHVVWPMWFCACVCMCPPLLKDGEAFICTFYGKVVII